MQKMYPKITIGNLCKPLNKVIIIPFSTSLNLKMLGKKEENDKKLKSQEVRAFSWNKKHFY